MSDFRKWWMDDDGSQKWPEALDAEGGTLKALEMVFNAGMIARTAELEDALERSGINGLKRRIKELEEALKSTHFHHKTVIKCCPLCAKETAELTEWMNEQT